MTNSPSVRVARLDDVAALSALKVTCFRQTFLAEGFNIPYPPADLALFEAESYGEEAVAAELANPKQQSWVAEDADGNLVGYARVGPCKLPHEEASADQGELYQLYLLKSAQGSGLGRVLLDTSLAWLASHYPGPVWLGVWSENHLAQAVYAKRGFEKVGEYGFPVGDWTDYEFIYRRP